MSAAGEKLSAARVANDPLAIAAAGAEAGPDPEVVIEAAYGWYWVVNLLPELLEEWFAHAQPDFSPRLRWRRAASWTVRRPPARPP